MNQGFIFDILVERCPWADLAGLARESNRNG